MVLVREQRTLTLLIFALLVACDSSGSSESAGAETALEEGAVEAGERAPLELVLHGALREVNLHQDYSPTVKLVDLEPTNHGLGALEGLMGEATVWGERLYLAEAADEEVTFRSMALADVADEAPELSATFFFGARVGRWETLEDHGVTTLAELEAFLQEWSEEESVEGPLAFRVTDPLATVEWHVVDATRFPEEGTSSCSERKEYAHSFQARREPVRLVGIFTRDHTGVVVDHTTMLHTHVITDRGHAGHVDDLTLSVGAVIEVGPRR